MSRGGPTEYDKGFAAGIIARGVTGNELDDRQRARITTLEAQCKRYQGEISKAELEQYKLRQKMRQKIEELEEILD